MKTLRNGDCSTAHNKKSALFVNLTDREGKTIISILACSLGRLSDEVLIC